MQTQGSIRTIIVATGSALFAAGLLASPVAHARDGIAASIHPAAPNSTALLLTGKLPAPAPYQPGNASDGPEHALQIRASSPDGVQQFITGRFRKPSPYQPGSDHTMLSEAPLAVSPENPNSAVLEMTRG